MRAPLILAAACLLAAGHAAAGAWTRAPGEGFVAQSVRFFSTEFTGKGDEPFRRASSDTYVEYGLREGLTIGGQLTFGQRGDGRQEGFARGFLRARLWRGELGVVSVEAGAGYPVLDAATPLDITKDQTADARLGVNYGRGWSASFGSGWFDAALYGRYRSQSPADELRLDLTAGYKPDDDWVFLAQSFTTMGLRNEGFTGADFDVTKLSLSVGYKILGGRTMLFSLTQDLLGRNISLGTEAAVTIWTEF